MIANTALLAALAVLALCDIKKKEFPLPFLGICAAAGLILCPVTGEPSPAAVVGGICVGGILLLCAAASRESIGFGDGLLFVVTGIYLGLWRNLMLLFFAALLCALAGLFLVLVKKRSRKESLPFAPFVLLSDVLLLALMM